MNKKTYDVIVSGAGHAGIEAALAAARMGAKTLLVTQKFSTVGALSCNPSFGGPAKGLLVKEIDAFGGFCGFGADKAAIQCRILGESKGPAARSTRNLVDRLAYMSFALDALQAEPNLDLLEDEIVSLMIKDKKVTGAFTLNGHEFLAGAIVLTGGTFWNGVVFHGLVKTPGGRVGEEPASKISDFLQSLGHTRGRLSTSTPPRLKAGTLNLELLQKQDGDSEAKPFSSLNKNINNSASCWLTWTNPNSHRAVERYLEQVPLRVGAGGGNGPRYCPSIEDKIIRFPERERHQIFLEPDGEELFFPSGLTTGLPLEAQQELINSIIGLEKAEIARPGYAIEYDFFQPTDLNSFLESLHVQGLFLAGQINGTSGYEEAAAQGLLAGVNAALKASHSDMLVLKRNEALSGVMVDDLTVYGVLEPYRVFGSRAEWRLLLREDNADLRLSPLADKLGLLDHQRKAELQKKIEDMEIGRNLLWQKITPKQSSELGYEFNLNQSDYILKESLKACDLLKRPGIKLKHLIKFIEPLEHLSKEALLTLETEIKFEGYIKNQEMEVIRLAKQEEVSIPLTLDFFTVTGLSTEAKELLSQKKPATLGQASRILGVTPADITVLSIALRQQKNS